MSHVDVDVEICHPSAVGYRTSDVGCRLFTAYASMHMHMQGTGKATGGGGGKGGTSVGPKDRTDKGNSLTEDTPRDAVTNVLRLHLHNFAYKTFKINNMHMSDVGCRVLMLAA